MKLKPLNKDNDIRKWAREIRKAVVRMHRIGPNVGSAMSAADILAVLYGRILNIPAPDHPDRDRFILSKGHAVSALYAALVQRGFFDRELLEKYMHDGTPLCGHPVKDAVPGIEVSTGSLGHGLPIGIGMALADRARRRLYRVYVLMGDGECQEGSVWEGAMIAARLGLERLTVIVDANGLQGYERSANILPVENIAAAWRAFGWSLVEIDGHDPEAIERALSDTPATPGKPTAIIARTIKGKGVAEMEDKLGWHYYSVPEDRLDDFLRELDKKR